MVLVEKFQIPTAWFYFSRTINPTRVDSAVRLFKKVFDVEAAWSNTSNAIIRQHFIFIVIDVVYCQSYPKNGEAKSKETEFRSENERRAVKLAEQPNACKQAAAKCEKKLQREKKIQSV